MRWQFVLQPNGKLGRFSEVLNDFTYVNLSPDDAIQLGANRYLLREEEAGMEVVAALEDRHPGTTTRGSGHDRWDRCLEIIKLRKGRDAVQRLMEDMVGGSPSERD